MKVTNLRTMMVIGGLAMAMAVTCTVLAARQNVRYLNKHPYYSDTSSYTLLDLRAYFQAKHDGRWAAIRDQLATNGRNPFRIVPVLALAPEWLASGNGHLATALVALFCFVALLGMAAHERTGSVWYAIAAMLAIVLPKSFFNAALGLGANQPDFVGGLFVGSAFLALLLSDQGRNNRWLVGFGIFASLAALSRWVAAGYTFVVCGPPLLYYLILCWRNDDRPWRGLGVRLACIAGPIALLAGYFLIAFSKQNLSFYSQAGYGIGLAIQHSYHNLYGVCSEYFGLSGCLGLGGICLTYFLCWWPARLHWSDLIVTAWAPISFILFFIFVLRLAGDPQTPYYAIALLQLFALTPFAVQPGASRPFGFARWVAPMAVVLILVTGGYGFYANRLAHRRASTQEIAEVEFQDALTRLLLDQGAACERDGYPSFDTFFSPYGRFLVVRAQTRHGEELHWKQVFEKHNVIWAMNYPGKSPEEIVESAYRDVQLKVDFVAILDEPRTKVAEPLFWDDFRVVQELAITVIEGMNQRLHANPEEWIHCGQVESPWGRISLFRKMLFRKIQEQ